MQSLEAQIDYYTNYIQNHPNWILVAVYSDTAPGNHTNQRPGYQQLLKDCVSKKVDLILVKSLSRFGRDALETIHQIRRLENMNIGDYIENGGINTLNASDSLIDQLAAIDQDESHFRSERNEGQLDTYLVEDAHEPIIDRETIQLVQQITGDIKKYR